MGKYRKKTGLGQLMSKPLLANGHTLIHSLSGMKRTGKTVGNP
jgi:hypothetical protein